jgi:hypothetical protein
LTTFDHLRKHNKRKSLSSLLIILLLFSMLPPGAIAATQPPAAPVFNPDGGSFVDSVEVGIDNIATGSTAYYTTDGTDPRVADSVYRVVYNELFTLTSSATVKETVYDGTSGQWSGEVGAVLSITPHAPPIASLPGTLAAR